MQSDTVGQIRAFNRRYTRWVGALDRRHLDTAYSLAEARVLYEVAHAPGIIARDIVDRLDLDPGYLSRLLKRFDADDIVERRKAGRDGRAASLHLTAAGRAVFTKLDRRAAERVGGAITGLSETEQSRLIAAMGIVAHLTEKSTSNNAANVALRRPQSGDYGWAIERHGVIYNTEFGWGTRFEGLVAELFGRFATAHDPERERCWIADVGGVRAGCVFVVERKPAVAQLRCLLVEPSARGLGVGRRLVEACIGFARDAGYRHIMLWTNKGLDSARKIYESVGFQLVDEQPHDDFGIALIGQNWELAL